MKWNEIKLYLVLILIKTCLSPFLGLVCLQQLLESCFHEVVKSDFCLQNCLNWFWSLPCPQPQEAQSTCVERSTCWGWSIRSCWHLCTKGDNADALLFILLSWQLKYSARTSPISHLLTCSFQLYCECLKSFLTADICTHKNIMESSSSPAVAVFRLPLCSLTPFILNRIKHAWVLSSSVFARKGHQQSH